MLLGHREPRDFVCALAVRGRERVLVYVCFASLLLAAGLAQAHEGYAARIAAITLELDFSPHDGELYLERALLRRELERFDGALSDLTHADRCLPQQRRRVALHRGVTLSKAARHEEAVQLLRRLLEPSVEDVSHEMYLALARSEVATQQAPAAIVSYRKSLETRFQVDIALELSRLQEVQSDPVGAAETLWSAYRRANEPVSLRVKIVELELRRRQFTAALHLVDEMLAKVPHAVTWQVRRGEILMAAGRHAEAKQAFLLVLSTVAEREQRRGTDLMLLAEARALVGLARRDEAVQILRALVLRSPERVEATALLQALDSERGSAVPPAQNPLAP